MGRQFRNSLPVYVLIWFKTSYENTRKEDESKKVVIRLPYCEHRNRNDTSITTDIYMWVF